MNRVTALIVAMAMLLAHSLAIHLDEIGRLGQPYDLAHRAFHLARNLVHEGVLAWNIDLTGSQRGGLDSYPSLLWVMVASVAERLYIPVNIFTQIFGIVIALLTVRVSVRFDEDRISSVIPALLLVTSGGFAAAAASGTEYSLVAFLLTASFVSYELKQRLPFALFLALLVLTRPESLFIWLAFLVFAGLERFGPHHVRVDSTAIWTLVPAGLLLVLMLALRNSVGGSLYGSWAGSILSPSTDRLEDGLGYLVDFTAMAVTPLLVVFPIVAWIARRLSMTGKRSLALALVWIAMVTAQGGGPQPFTLGLIPAFPLLAIAIQQGILAALDTHRATLERLAWASLMISSLLSVFASKFPGNLGRLQVKGSYMEWVEAAVGPVPYSGQPLRGRASLGFEIRQTAELRNIGRFLQENVDHRYTILTPWPGAIGYLSRMKVLDLLSRITAPEGIKPTPPWPPRPRIDLVAALEQRADFILLDFVDLKNTREGPLRLWVGELLGMDLNPEDPERTSRIDQLLREYEMVTLPIVPERDLRRGRPRSFPLMRRKDLGLAPTLTIKLEGQRLCVDTQLAPPSDDAARGSHMQLARLEVQALDAQGKVWRLDPSGTLSDNRLIFARTELRLQPGGEQPTRLGEWPMPTSPQGARLVEIRARLFNPILDKNHPYAVASEEVHLVL